MKCNIQKSIMARKMKFYDHVEDFYCKIWCKSCLNQSSSLPSVNFWKSLFSVCKASLYGLAACSTAYRGIFWHYLTLFHLPPLRFHCVRGCWDGTRDCCDFGNWQPNALTTRLDLIHIWLCSISCARNYRPSFRENKPKTFIFYDWIRAFWACFRENAGL